MLRSAQARRMPGCEAAWTDKRSKGSPRVAYVDVGVNTRMLWLSHNFGFLPALQFLEDLVGDRGTANHESTCVSPLQSQLMLALYPEDILLHVPFELRARGANGYGSHKLSCRSTVARENGRHIFLSGDMASETSSFAQRDPTQPLTMTQAIKPANGRIDLTANYLDMHSQESAPLLICC